MSDLRIRYDEEMVGCDHPTKADTLNRLATADHGTDGLHRHAGLIFGLGQACTDGATVALKGGSLDIRGRTYTLPESVGFTPTGLPASSWAYLLVEAPGSGHELAAAQFSWSATAPARDSAQGGAFYDSSGEKRCVGVFKTTSGCAVKPYYTGGGRYWHITPSTSINTTAPATANTSLSLDLPGLGPLPVCCSLYVYMNNAQTYQVYVGPEGSSPLGDYSMMVGYAPAPAGYSLAFETMAGASGAVVYGTVWNGAGTMIIYLRGFGLPRGLAG